MGGKCSRCGYCKNLSALQFHHVSPQDKSIPLDLRRLSNSRWEVLLKEARKCLLLCANCHAEIHHPELDFDLITKTILGASGEKSSDAQRVNSGKPTSETIRQS